MKPELDDTMHPNRYQTDGSCLTVNRPSTAGLAYIGGSYYTDPITANITTPMPPDIPKIKPVESTTTKAHNHYFKSVKKLEYIDVYRVIELFGITDPCIQHAVKKLLVAGGRGHKNIDKDIQDVIDSCTRWQEMRKEDKNG